MRVSATLQLRQLAPSSRRSIACRFVTSRDTPKQQLHPAQLPLLAEGTRPRFAIDVNLRAPNPWGEAACELTLAGTPLRPDLHAAMQGSEAIIIAATASSSLANAQQVLCAAVKRVGAERVVVMTIDPSTTPHHLTTHELVSARAGVRGSHTRPVTHPRTAIVVLAEPGSTNFATSLAWLSHKLKVCVCVCVCVCATVRVCVCV